MTECAFKEKFVAFIDVMGFKSMIQATERGQGRSVEEIKEILRDLARPQSKERFVRVGPKICPRSQLIDKSLSFEVTQISDCVIISAEVSPAGVINLVEHCWHVVMALLMKGVLVRGYITRGSIIHGGNLILGSGYQAAYERETGVAAFRKEADEKGTPFVELDSLITDYINGDSDECVREMFSRMVKSDGDVTALYPFDRIDNAFTNPFDAAEERKFNSDRRSKVTKLIELINGNIDPKNESALRKTRHYVSALQEQLNACDRKDEIIDALSKSFGLPAS